MVHRSTTQMSDLGRAAGEKCLRVETCQSFCYNNNDLGPILNAVATDDLRSVHI